MNSFSKITLGTIASVAFATVPALAEQAQANSDANTGNVASQSETLTVEHLNNFRQLYDVKVSPDGGALVYGIKNGQEKGANHLYLRDLSTEKVSQLTSNKASEHTVQWASDSKGIYFLSSRSGSSQVWFLSLGGGEAKQLTDFPMDVGGYKMAADGKTMALAFDVKPGCETLQCSVEAKQQLAAQKHNTRAYDQLMVRHWDHWLDTFNTHLFVATLPETGKLTDATDLMPEWNADIAGMSQVSFHPDGTKLAFSAKSPDRDHAWTTNWDIFEVDLATNAMTNITEDNKAWDALPHYSSDGRYLAWKAMKTEVYESDKFSLKVKDLRSSKVQDVAPLWDRSISDFHFSDDNRSVIALAQDVGQKSIFSISLQFGEVTPVYQNGYAGDVTSAGKAIYFTRHTLDTPADIYTINKDGYGFKQLTDINKDTMAKLQMGEFKQFSFPGWNDEKVYGYWLKPANFEEGKKYPIAFLVHGGPQGSFGNMFHYRWNAQLWAAQGYGVVMIDFHGSTGYGQKFTDSISGDWGGKPLEDLQKGFAYITEKETWLDGDNACALGASYGGYMMNWFMGKWSDGFNCIVNHAGLFDMKSFYYSTEELWFPEHDFSGPYYEFAENYDKFDPSRFVDNWKMPMLVIQGELDYRVPYAQSLGAFTTLQRKGIDSRLVMFPDEDHHIRKPDNLKEWYREVFAWMEKYLKGQNAE
ncbi:prolyl oligopeptidase family serine peptidase [Thalassotalea sp. PS06]|uniref:S9 family peptidase n=1 Tax=Thalassotalea sp. PS06 TaxID=2594005 RepID=UPI001161EAFF|nr:S9 family peptidase [Thalassotalea sp. PS06]QDP01638.1 S9 family peptidase [Thalassotalea sp. PS06]